ncbi:PREDICTED: xyloglucan endotransglucosylase/hydrolase protein 2-like [Tarenaya hassleriana]|uniref:xyloglucan endotransglucosylase/hydrolase protein 2-like n=1 Tax=Tarenaya hassleriana TaxID=28532 RepID=UPI00053C65DC|nr:PREDICTED: xyloglucan endotransglucosylase/hydrolase protein 2-like [Tarenaya hassleriana]
MEHVLIFYSMALLLIIGSDAGVLVDRGIHENGISFDDKYVVTWGQDHVFKLGQGQEIQLSLDQLSGCGFESKSSYGSGFFQTRIKLPDQKDSSGVITAFYLTSKGENHDEVDFEFLGNRQGDPITLQTNVFADGKGDREQRILLWFDPSKDFHSYSIVWNPTQILFYVDEIPIRVFKNNKDKGVGFPTKAMQVVGSLWNGTWASGKTQINWAYAPFSAHFQSFDIPGCAVDSNDGNALGTCGSAQDWWNAGKYVVGLSGGEEKEYQNVRAKYMNYDYCVDRSRYPTPPPECV